MTSQIGLWRTSNMWCCLMSHSFSCFRYGTGTMRLWIPVKKATCKLVVFHNNMTYVYVTLVGFSGLLGESHVSLLCDHLHPFIDSIYPNNDEINGVRINHCHWLSKLPRIHLRSILGTFGWMVQPSCSPPNIKPVKHLWDGDVYLLGRYCTYKCCRAMNSYQDSMA